MKNLVYASLVFLFCTCKPVAETPLVCQPPTTLVAQATCESGFQGTLLIASNYQQTSSTTSMLFEVFPQKDTLSSNLNVKAWKNGSNQFDRILISDDIIGNAPKFLAQVTINCSGTEYRSKYFAFVKRPAANPACFVWRQQAN